MKLIHRTWIGLFVGIFVTVIVLLRVGLWYSRPKQQPELQRFIQRAQMVKVEMTKEQVDNILRDYPEGWEMNEVWEVGGSDSLIRPSVVTKVYVLFLHSGTTAVDGDYFIEVYFDKEGLVVGTHIGEYER